MAARKKAPATGAPRKSPSVETLSAVLALFKESGLTELDFEDTQVRVRLSRASSGVAVQAPVAFAAPAAASHPHVTAPSAPAPKEEGGHVITSPFVGTFYRSPNPNSPAFVNVGSVVKKGQTLCIVEAMKLMNEIEADTDGKLAEICVENAQPVEFGQKLFRIVPA
jgi:acetyl-CoA carboxylase biotin carboxyl carrier protein